MKMILRQFLIFFLTWSVLNLQLGVVMAESSISVDDGSISRDDSGHASRVAKVANSDSEEDMSGTGAMTMLTMIAIGFVTWRILDMCMETATTDIYLAAAAGAAFIIGEMIAIFGYDDNREKELEVHIGNDENEEQQTEALKKQRQTYQDIADTADSKSTLQIAAAVGFAAAAGFATKDWYFLTTAMESCEKATEVLSATTTKLDPLSSSAGVVVPLTAPSCATSKTSYLEIKKAYEQTDHEAPSRVTFDKVTLGSKDLVTELSICGGNIKTVTKGITAAMNVPATSAQALNANKVAVVANSEHTAAMTACRELSSVVDKTAVFCVPEKTDAENEAEAAKAKPRKFGRNNRNVHGEFERPNLKPTAPKSELPTSNSGLKNNSRGIQKFKNGGFNKTTAKATPKNVIKPCRGRGCLKFKGVNLYFDSPVEFVANLIAQSRIDYKKQKAKEAIDYDPEVFATNFFKAISNLVAPAAHAFNMGMMNGIGLVGAAAGIVAGLTMDYSFELDKYAATPGWRAILWGAFGALTVAAIAETNSAKEEAEENVKKLDQIIERMERLKTGVAYANDSKRGISDAKISAIDTRNRKATGKNNKTTKLSNNVFPCTTTLANGKCASTEHGINNSSGFSGLPNQLQAAGSNLGRTIDSATNKPLVQGTTLDLASQVGDARNAANRYLKNAQRKLNQSRINSGKLPINFDGKGQELLNTLRGTVSNGSGGSSGLGAGSLSSFGGKGLKVSGEDKGLKAIPTSQRTGLKYSGGGSKSGGRGKYRRFRQAGISNATQAELATNAEKVKAMKQLKDQGDIVDNEHAFIFDIISSRFIKSGYSRLLDDE